MGVVGALVILHRSWSLILEVSPALLDAQPAHDDKAAWIRAQLEDDGVELFDLRNRQIAPGRHATIVAPGATETQPPSYRKARLVHMEWPACLSAKVERTACWGGVIVSSMVVCSAACRSKE